MAARRKDVFRKLQLIFLVVATVGCSNVREKAHEEKKGDRIMEFTILSDAFKDGGLIPKKYTCDGPDVSPPLTWKGEPAGVKSFALIVDDPDAPMGTWVHWVIFNIPSSVKGLKEGIPHDERLPDGTMQGKNDFNKIGYGGPCPPGGTHRYFFKLYAVDTVLSISGGVTKDKLLSALNGHIMAETRLIGRYSR